VLEATEKDKSYRVLRTGTGIMDCSSRTRIRITGSMRAKFLQGILTNDTNLLSPGRGLYAAVLTGKGKMQSDLTVYALAEWYWIDAEPEVAGTLPALIGRYTIGTDAVVTNLSTTHSVLAVYGPTAAHVLATGLVTPAPVGNLVATEVEWGGHRMVVAESGLPDIQGYKILLPSEAVEKTLNALIAQGAERVDADALDIIRIECGIPRFGADMSSENFPPEARIESRAVSYTKGCYMGQETIARINTYGHVNRLLVGLLPDTDQVLASGTRIVSTGPDAKDVGYVTSSVFSPAVGRVIALGYVHRTLEAPGTAVMLGTERPVRAVVVSLPFAATT
jgi:folate-binding protein YgfZ